MAKGKIKSAIGIELTGDQINLVQLAKTVEGIILVAARSIKLPVDKREDDKKILVDNIIKIFQGLDYTKDAISLGVGGHMSFVRKVKLPPVSHSKLKQVISFEVQQQVPFSLNEVIWDYQTISPITKIPGPIVVLIAAIKQSFVEDLLKILKDSVNKIPDVVDTSALALHNCLVFNDLLPKEKVGILINLGFTYTDVSIENNGEIVFTRAVPIGRKNILKKIAELKGVEIGKAKEILNNQAAGEDISAVILSILEDLIAEIKRTTNYYLSQVEKVTHFQYVYISGEFPANSNLSEILKNSFRVEVEEINPFTKVAHNTVDLTSSAANFCVSTGLALRLLEHTGVEINLLPPKILNKKKLANKKMFFIGSIAVLFLIGWFMLVLGERSYNLISGKNKIIEPLLKSYTPYVSTIEGLKRSKEEIATRLKDIEGILKQKSQLSEILLEISRYTPTDIYIIGISSGEVGGIGAVETRSAGWDAPVGYRSVPSLEPGWDAPRGAQVPPATSPPEQERMVEEVATVSQIQRISLNGVTASFPTIDEYINQMKTSPLFKTVELVSAISTSQPGGTSSAIPPRSGGRGRISSAWDAPTTSTLSAEGQVQFMLTIELQKD